jgi:hypothetical protein
MKNQVQMTNNRGREKRRYNRSPDFDSGILSEPLLSFGGRHAHVDPKTGLGLYGPYTLVGQDKPSPSSIVVGTVGPPSMIADCEQWFKACSQALINDGSEPFLYPHFPGFNSSHPFQCELLFGDTWREIIKPDEIQRALSGVKFLQLIQQVLDLYLQGIENLSKRDPKPNVILCSIPQEVIDYCTVRVTSSGEKKRRKVTTSEKRADAISRMGQLFLFSQMDPTLGLEEGELVHQNLRRALKAEAMKYEIPTQIVWPRTLQLSGERTGQKQSQDIATRAWNFITALYHKSGGTPWRLAEIEPQVCFVGVSFYREIAGSTSMRTSMAQTFTAAGDGYVLRGDSFDWDESRYGRSPHLDQKAASALMKNVLDLYSRQNRGSLPGRIVVHKSSKYLEEELIGFGEACQIVPRSDFVAFGDRGVQFYRPGNYPPLRGTYVKFSDMNLLLYTVGWIPFLRTYPGARAPRPIEILEHHGDSPWSVVLQEVLALTKMNWNTADFACSLPITLAFAQRVSQILAELPADINPRPEYRFYM